MKLLTTKEAAAHIGMSAGWLADARQAGKGPIVTRLGGAVRYDIADLDAFIKASKEQPCPSTESQAPDSGSVDLKSTENATASARRKQIVKRLKQLSTGSAQKNKQTRQSEDAA